MFPEPRACGHPFVLSPCSTSIPSSHTREGAGSMPTGPPHQSRGVLSGDNPAQPRWFTQQTQEGNSPVFGSSRGLAFRLPAGTPRASQTTGYSLSCSAELGSDLEAEEVSPVKIQGNISLTILQPCLWGSSKNSPIF